MVVCWCSCSLYGCGIATRVRVLTIGPTLVGGVGGGCPVDGLARGFLGGYGKRGTPGPFPNPVVKALSADGTAPGRCVGE